MPGIRSTHGNRAEALGCEDYGEAGSFRFVPRGIPPEPRRRRRRDHADLTAGRQPNRQMRARGKGALSGRTGRQGSISFRVSVREGSGVSVSQPVSRRPKMRPTADWTNAFVKSLCPRRRQPSGPQP